MFTKFSKVASRLTSISARSPAHNFSSAREYVFPNRERLNIFTNNNVGVLSRILNTFHHHQVPCTNVTTKLLNRNKDGSQRALFTIDFESNSHEEKVHNILKELNLFSDAKIDPETPEVPWFPTKMSDLDSMGNSLQNPDEDAGKDHPGFKDSTYKARRDEIAKGSVGYIMGQEIPRLKYRPEENKTWEHIYKILRPLQEKYMCDSFNKSFEKMISAGILKSNEIPQLQDLNDFLIKETNFRLKPVTGILSQREFMDSLALRTFCCTQYIRHHSVPEYTPEPDIIHEILGHVAMFADPDFCNLSQEIGLLSLGNSTENVSKLGALYWYTVEFGVCNEGNDVKGYGAGIASSIGEIKHFGEKKAEFRPLNPFVELKMDFPIQTVQPMYYVAKSFKDAGNMLIRYGEYLPKPFKAYFNHQKNAVEIDRKVKLIDVNEKAVDF